MFYNWMFLFSAGACLVCPPGRTCPNQGMNDTLPCPTGYYCTNGTSGNGDPCPLGTYNPQTEMKEVSDCLPCPPGQYCSSTGLSNSTGDCLAGYLCLGNATSAAPNDGVNGPCPVGHYCLQGTVEFIILLFLPGRVSLPGQCHECRTKWRS